MRLLTNSPTSGAGTSLVVCCSRHWMKPGEVYQSSVPPYGHSVWVWIPSPDIRRVGWRGVFDAPLNRATVL
jgi:hypothetical protein